MPQVQQIHLLVDDTPATVIDVSGSLRVRIETEVGKDGPPGGENCLVKGALGRKSLLEFYVGCVDAIAHRQVSGLADLLSPRQRDLRLWRDRLPADDRQQVTPGAWHDVEYGVSPAPRRDPPSVAELVGQFGHREVGGPLTIQAEVQIG